MSFLKLTGTLFLSGQSANLRSDKAELSRAQIWALLQLMAIISHLGQNPNLGFDDFLDFIYIAERTFAFSEYQYFNTAQLHAR